MKLSADGLTAALEAELLPEDELTAVLAAELQTAVPTAELAAEIPTAELQTELLTAVLTAVKLSAVKLTADELTAVLTASAVALLIAVAPHDAIDRSCLSATAPQVAGPWAISLSLPRTSRC